MVGVRGTLDANHGAAGFEFRGTDGSDVPWATTLLGPEDGFVMSVTVLDESVGPRQLPAPSRRRAVQRAALVGMHLGDPL